MYTILTNTYIYMREKLCVGFLQRGGAEDMIPMPYKRIQKYIKFKIYEEI